MPKKYGYYPANNKYQRENLLRVTVPFNRKHEPELVEKMEEQENKAGYLKRLVKEDIERDGNAQGQESK